MESRGAVLWSEGGWNSGLAVVGYHSVVKNSYQWTSWVLNILPKEGQPLAHWPPVHYLIVQVEQDVNTSIAQFDRISIWKPQLMRWVLYSIAKLYFLSVTNKKKKVISVIFFQWVDQETAISCRHLAVCPYINTKVTLWAFPKVSRVGCEVRCIRLIIPSLFRRCLGKKKKQTKIFSCLFCSKRGNNL